VEYDLLIRGGRVVDGSHGAVPFPADVAVRGDRIAAVGPLSDARAAIVIEASGRLVSPGFIDPHVHSETALRGNRDEFGALLQGVTTHLTGADGFGWAGVGDQDVASLWQSTAFAYGQGEMQPNWPSPGRYLESFHDLPLNVAALAPHQAIRFGTLGWTDRPATRAELRAMRRSTREWLEAGAVGLATGLDYQPAASATTEELVALCREAAAAGVVYAPHQRYNELGRAGAFAETIEIGRRAGIAVAVSHEFVDDETEPILDGARADVDITIDWYLYPAGSTHLLSLLPVAEAAGGPRAVRARLSDPGEKERVARLFDESLEQSSRSGAREYFSATRTGRHIGRSIAEVASQAGASRGETAVDLLLEEMPDALLVFRRNTPPETFAALARRTLAWPGFMVASDGIYHGALPHPRAFGCFARVLGQFVRTDRAISIGDAVYRMAGFPAERYRLRDRGRIAAGLAADLVVFDPETVDGPATWDEPRLPPTGIDAVILNGALVVDHGLPTGLRRGRVLRREG